LLGHSLARQTLAYSVYTIFHFQFPQHKLMALYNCNGLVIFLAILLLYIHVIKINIRASGCTGLPNSACACCRSADSWAYRHTRICTPLATVIALILRMVRYHRVYTRVSTGTDFVTPSFRLHFEIKMFCSDVASFPASSIINIIIIIMIWSRDSDWQRARRPSARSSSPGTVKNFFLSTSFRLALGSTQPPFQWVPGALSPGGKAAGA
jgi:hypothetical protein